MDKKLPVYKMVVADDEITGISTISFVEFPAIEENFIAFSTDSKHPIPIKLAIQDEEKRIVTGPVLIADMPVYRKDSSGEYYIYTDKENIYQIAQKFFKGYNNNNINAEHGGMLITGVTMFESFITDSSRGISAPAAFAGIADGSWFASYKIDNEELWTEIKAGTFKGFSIEGLFDFIPVTLSANKQDKSPLEIYHGLNDIFKNF